MAKFLFNLAWDIDFMTVSKEIEECEYIHVDEAYDYVCSNYSP